MLKTNIMKIKTVLLIAIAMLANLLNAQAQNVYIPDSIFKAALVNNASINTNMDTAIQVSEANAYTGAIHVAALGITDLTGIAAFIAIDSLDCSGNQLTALNVSGCIALTTLDCSINQLLNLNVSGCIGIGALYCSSNQLTSLNIKNGNNHNMGSSGFKATNNPNLRCIEVDSAAWSTFYWTYWSNSIDSTASFSENCNYGSGIRNNTIEQSKALQMYPNPTTGIINLTANSNMELTDITGKVLMQKQNSKQLDISTLPVGIYLLRTGDNLNHTFKVIKE